MKKLITLLLAAGLVCSSVSMAKAADIKAKGVWDFNIGYAETSFSKSSGADRFHALQRFRTQIDIIASESLSGVVFFEIGDTNWGNASQGGSIGTDGTTVEVRYSYVNWSIPNTDVRVRMGLQPFILPGFVAGSAILDADGAGIVVSNDFTENVGASLFWLRAENDNTSGWFNGRDDNQNNALDMLGLTLPLKFDGLKVTPWGMYSFVGNRSLSGEVQGDMSDLRAGMLPVLPYGSTINGIETNKSRGNAWWVGISGELTHFDPFRVALDFNYGSVDLGDINGAYADGTTQTIDMKRSGWLVSGIAEYKFDRVTPGLLLWYGSGDNSNPYDGSERMPNAVGSWEGSKFGFDGGYGISPDAILSSSPIGTWGVALRLSDLSFMEDLTHSFQVGYYRGTNDKHMPANAGLTTYHTSFSDAGGMVGSTYLTTKDGAWEVNFDTEYKLYQNLSFVLDLAYLRLDLNDGVWGQVIDGTEKNAYKAGINMRYSF